MSRTKLFVWVSALFIAGLVYSQTRVVTDPQTFIDELLATVLSPDAPPPLNLPLVTSNAVPATATFWSAQASEDSPPYPFNPFADLGLPVYSLGNNSFLFDDRAVNYDAWNQVQSALRLLASGGGMTMNSLDFPDDGTNEFDGEWTNNYVSPVYTTNDLWLEWLAESVTNGTGTIALHIPESYGDAAWDLFATTNLSVNTEADALNVTNWLWLARTTSAQTNLTVNFIWSAEAYFRLAATNDTDGDTLTDAFETLVSHSNASTNDTDGDGLFDAWEWMHFGNFDQGAGDDYDNDSSHNLAEQANLTDPNTLTFTAHLGYGQTASLNPTATLTLLGGVPADYAVMVDSTNFDSPNWQTFTTSPVVPLPDADGEHLVWVALRGRVNATDWQGFGVTLDRVAPALVITGPTNSTTFKPVIQVTGYSTDAVWSVSCTLSNATGMQTNLSALATATDFGPVTTNHFQVFDVELTHGVNALTVKVSDLAGNVSTTNLSITFDTTGDSNAPALTVLWPQSGAKLGADTFTLRARSDDEAANISATVVPPSGATNQYTATVERNGAVWVEDIALEAGTNWVTLTATDAATNSYATNLTLIRSSVSVTIAEPGNLNDPFVTVNGTVSDGSYSVWVNGVMAAVSGNAWTATNVALPAGGSAVVAVTVVPSGGSSSGGSGGGDPSENNPSDPGAVEFSIQPEKPAEVKLVHGEWSREVRDNILPPDESPGLYLMQHNWRYDEQAGGYAESISTSPASTNGVRYWLNPDGTESYATWQTTTDNVVSTNWVDLATVFWSGFEVNGPLAEGLWQKRTAGNWGTSEQTWSARKVKMVLRNHQRAGMGRLFLAEIFASAEEKLAASWRSIVPTDIVIPPLGPLDENGHVLEFVAAASEADVTPKMPGAYKEGNETGAGAFLTLKDVTFQGTGYHAVLCDTNGQPYPPPHWVPGTNYPALFESGTKLGAKVKFKVREGVSGGQIFIKGVAKAEGVSFELWGTANLPTTAGADLVVDTEANTALEADKVNCFNKLKITWTCQLLTGTKTDQAGSSENQVYVTWDEPQYPELLYHTAVHLACKNKGGTNLDSVFANTWQSFSSGSAPANVTAWDEKTKLHYYKSGLAFSNAVTDFTVMLSNTNHNGQCGAWATLFKAALWVNRHTSLGNATISPPGGTRYLIVSNWIFGATNIVGSTFQWENEVAKTAQDNPEMVPLSGVTGPVSPMDGVAGQNSPTPAEKIFTSHTVVKNTRDNKYYDPSYGKVYTNGTDFESQALAGYAIRAATNSTTITIQIRKPDTGLDSAVITPYP